MFFISKCKIENVAYKPETIKELISLGGNLTISGNYRPDTLKEFIKLANSNNVHLTLKVDNLKSDTLKDLVRLGKKNLTLEL